MSPDFRLSSASAGVPKTLARGKEETPNDQRPTPNIERLSSDRGLRLVLADGLREGDIAALEIQRCLFRRSKNAGAVIVEFALPSRDYYGRQTIADEVYAGATHVH